MRARLRTLTHRLRILERPTGAGLVAGFLIGLDSGHFGAGAMLGYLFGRLVEAVERNAKMTEHLNATTIIASGQYTGTLPKVVTSDAPSGDLG